jgi:hypothetical protein
MVDGIMMSAHWAAKTIETHVCSQCWGSLAIRWEVPTEGAKVVCCSSCDETRGFVSRQWVDERRTQDHFDAYEVSRLLQSLGIIDRPPRRSEDQILEELGF